MPICYAHVIFEHSFISHLDVAIHLSVFLNKFIQPAQSILFFTTVMHLILLCLCLYKIQESDEARKKFSNAKSISSSQFFGDQNKANADAQATLSKFSVCVLSFSNLP